MNKDKVNQLNAEIEQIIDNVKGAANPALKILVDNLADNGDVSVYRAIIDILEKSSPDAALNILFKLIDRSVYADKVVFDLIRVVKNHIYLIKKNSEIFDSLKNCIDTVICTYHQFSIDTLLSVADFLEVLFAKGYEDIHTYIVRMYKVIPATLMNGRDYSIHKELICVYSYNGLNFKQLNRQLWNILDKCKASKRKYLYGEVNYYRAVLEKLSGESMYYNNVRCIDYACDAGYELAFMLRDNI